MGCCKDVPRNEAEMFEGLPESSVMCLARMAYQLACSAEYFYTGRERVTWERLHDTDCAVFATKARAAMAGKKIEGSPLDHLFGSMLRSLVRAV